MSTIAKKIAVLSVFCLAMMWTYDAAAQQHATINNHGYYEVTIPFTWLHCSDYGIVYVDVTWSGGQHGSASGLWQGAGCMVTLSTLAYPGYVTLVKFTVQAYETKFNPSPPNVVQIPNPNPAQYQHAIPPGKCVNNTNDCKKYPNGMVICTVGPGPGPDPD